MKNWQFRVMMVTLTLIGRDIVNHLDEIGCAVGAGLCLNHWW